MNDTGTVKGTGPIKEYKINKGDWGEKRWL